MRPPSPATSAALPPSLPLRIGNFSGFYGDRFDALYEMLTGGALDVLTGDYLAELTMLILGRDRMRDPGLGYARTFLKQLEGCLGTAYDRGVRIVTNAGGVNPAALAERIRELTARLGIPVRVAHVTGDDLIARPGARNAPAAREDWGAGAVTAHAYLGGHGITACLRAGADIVVTGRVTDAALVTGPAAWRFGWDPDDPGTHDRLAGAVVAGHVLECGAQATGGNYAFFAAPGKDGGASGADRVRRPGFPLAELHEDGSCVITKHPGTGGFVDIGTVTAQLLYETAGAQYAGPDVTARLDTVRLTQEGPDRVRIDGVRGEPPPPTLKVGLNRLGGWRGEVVFVLTGLDVDAKAALVRAQMEDALVGRRPAVLRWELARTDHPDPGTEEAASALLRLVARDPDEAVVGRALGAAAVELALASYPGFHVTAPPVKGTPYAVFQAAYVPQQDVEHVAVLPDGREERIPAPTVTREVDPTPVPEASVVLDSVSDPSRGSVAASDGGPEGGGVTRRVPLGVLAGARSGDKGGDANIGVWARHGSHPDRTDAVWRWLERTLTVDRLRTLLPECAQLTVVRHVLPNLRAVNFVVEGLLGEGVAARHRFDPQAKALGEWLRARLVDVPEELLEDVPEESLGREVARPVAARSRSRGSAAAPRAPRSAPVPAPRKPSAVSYAAEEPVAPCAPEEQP
ncbi:acyclic terpene utilization AtuA family protein [Streptomyces odontomachi]|uniref:acyclic terpene utilization AtuA family protein n=1 Tax=Streptomyces odontomachi TaxID=2944940 RepID=UPI00210BBBA2|nr:acyclic terpene utilization AtuA family protein [Streptomyces sp. ODS25]